MRSISASRPHGSSSSYSPSEMSSGPITETGTTATPVTASCAEAHGVRSSQNTSPSSVRLRSASWRMRTESGSFFLGQRRSSTKRAYSAGTVNLFRRDGSPADRGTADRGSRPHGVRRRPALLRAREEAGVAGARPALGGAASDPRGEGLAAAAGAAAGHVALRPDAAAAGGHARLRHGVAAPQLGARPGGEALLLDDGAG